MGGAEALLEEVKKTLVARVRRVIANSEFRPETEDEFYGLRAQEIAVNAARIGQ